MSYLNTAVLLVSSMFSAVSAAPALANGEIIITQTKAIAGNVTPGDLPGFPVTLSLPGAYVVESNLSVPSGLNGILANAHNIDLDMNGFSLTGGSVAYYGIVSSFGESRIHDGVINTFRFVGIYLTNNAWEIEDMQVVRNGGHGIAASGQYINIRDSLIAANGSGTNGGAGMMIGDYATIRNNSISKNTLNGIICGVACHIEGNSVTKNDQSGIQAWSGLAIGNTISDNRLFGIYSRVDLDFGISNNIFINNNSSDTRQNSGVITVHPNACVGKPC